MSTQSTETFVRLNFFAIGIPFEKLEALVDADLIRAVNALLLPAGGSTLIPATTFTLILRGLATSVRASPTIAVSLLEADIVTTVYQILTGVLPPAVDDSDEQGNSATGQGLGGGLADMTVMQNLAHRPKEQVFEPWVCRSVEFGYFDVGLGGVNCGRIRSQTG